MFEGGAGCPLGLKRGPQPINLGIFGGEIVCRHQCDIAAYRS